MVALRGQSTWRVFIIHVLSRAFADALLRRGCLGTRHSSFLARLNGVIGDARKIRIV